MKKILLSLLMISGSLQAEVVYDLQRGSCRIDGKEHPFVGYGTYPLTGKTCTDAVARAIREGYRIIDTATMYNNFDAIKKALKGQDRKDFYIISKVWHDRLYPADIRRDLDNTLQALDTPYLDCYFVHWPNSNIPIEQTLFAMDDLRKKQKILHIGLSNVTASHLKRALEVGVPITWVQVEMHPYFYDEELLAFCKKHGISVQAWGPVGRGQIQNDKLLIDIGSKYGKSASQVALRWIIQHGCLPIPQSKKTHHMKENIDVRNFSLNQ